MYEPKFIKADGKKSAPIALIGEAGGKNENRIGRPFVGWSGKLLQKWWGQVGLDRKRDFWIDNVFPFMPPLRANTPVLSLVHPDDLKAWTENLHDRIAELTNVNVIVPTGDIALRALTGLKGITKYRGSVLSYNHTSNGAGREIKVIPTIHPAACARQPTWEKTCIIDWERIAAEAKFPEIILPEREHFTRPTLDDLYWYGEQLSDFERLAIDAEWTDKELLCVGFAADPSFSFTVPTTVEYWGSKKKLAEAMLWIKSMCEGPNEKILHHGHSDAHILRWYAQIGIANFRWDTLAMHHTVDPNSPHDLAFLASILTRQPYWKDEAKEPDKIARYASNFDALLTYNGIDVAVTYELFKKLYDILNVMQMMDFYIEHYAEILDDIVNLQMAGINVDNRQRCIRQTLQQCKVIELQNQMTEIAGEPVFRKKSLSGKVLQRYFYETLNLPQVMRVRKRKSGEKVKTPSIDEVAVKRLMMKHEEAKPLGQLLLDHRRAYQLLLFYG